MRQHKGTRNRVVMPVKKYYLLRTGATVDSTQILAIHQVFDSCRACFDRARADERYNAYLEMVSLEMDSYGFINAERILFTFEREMGIVCCRMLE